MRVGSVCLAGAFMVDDACAESVLDDEWLIELRTTKRVMPQ